MEIHLCRLFRKTAARANRQQRRVISNQMFMEEFTNKTDIIKTLESLQEDWMLVDDFPDKDFLVLVNRDRDVMEGFYPKKDLVANMDKQGLIKNNDDLFKPQPKTFSYSITHVNGKTEEVVQHNPHVY